MTFGICDLEVEGTGGLIKISRSLITLDDVIGGMTQEKSAKGVSDSCRRREDDVGLNIDEVTLVVHIDGCTFDGCRDAIDAWSLPDVSGSVPPR